MLHIVVPETEHFDYQTNEFIVTPERTLQLEHSLVSISKWESKWNKPFLSQGNKTDKETLDYVQCMTLTQNVAPIVYECLTQENIDEISTYIDAPMTATTFAKSQELNREVITSEIIYYWMIALTIPFECQKWHLNRLLTLINVCNIKNQPKKKMSRAELARRNAELNAQRRAKLKTKG